MSFRTKVILSLAVGLLASAGAATAARHYVRQYYSSWSYHPARSYYYSYYYYKPYVSYSGYSYHYAICYPSTPRYVYYYNPYSQVYWGRLDTEAKGDDKYSLLEDKDRKKELKDIPESAFPKPAKMPAIPESKDDLAMEAPKELPPKQ
jgi:hypothetical protein